MYASESTTTTNTLGNPRVTHHAPADEAIVAGERLTVRFGTRTALDAVTVRVMPGEIVALVGPNGAGKTTLIECLTCQRRPDSGTVRLFGVPRTRLSRLDRSRMGVVIQESRTDSELTVREHLEMLGGYFGAGREQIDRALHEVGLAGQSTQRIHKLSGGQRRKVEVAGALIGDPELVFLDEPTTGLDIDTREALWALITSARERGAGIVLTTHYLEEAESLADRVDLLVDARIVASGTVSEFIERAELPRGASLADAYQALVADTTRDDRITGGAR